jgi:hypothetical protein
MSELLIDLIRIVKRLERGESLPKRENRTEAIRAMIERACAAEWKTQDEREQVQALVNRLWLWGIEDRRKAPGRVAVVPFAGCRKAVHRRIQTQQRQRRA